MFKIIQSTLHCTRDATDNFLISHEEIKVVVVANATTKVVFLFRIKIFVVHGADNSVKNTNPTDTMYQHPLARWKLMHLLRTVPTNSEL